MPLGDVSEQQNHVSSYYGADTSLIPASFDVALFTGTPVALGGDGVEADYPGYARVTVTNNTTNYVPDTDGSATATVTFPAATDAAGTGSSVVVDDLTTWVQFNGTAIDSWDSLSAPISVDSAGAVEAIAVTPYIPNSSSVTA
jgi:hypothetical protein